MLKTKEQKGITLIALIITIIIMLILAGVTIKLTLGENGIFTKAKEAKAKMEKAMLIEQIQTEILEKQLQNDSGNISEKDLEEILGKYGEVQKDEEGKIIGVKPEGKEKIAIEDIVGKTTGTTGESNEEETGGNTTVEIGKEATEQGTINGEKGNYTNPTIPKGYYPINTDNAQWDKENKPEYDNGLVITDEVDAEGKSIGNEWVWVPIKEPTDLYEEVTEPIAITGGTTNVISNVATKIYSKSAIINEITRVVPNDTSSYREPDVLVGQYGTVVDAVEANLTSAGFSSLENMASTLVAEYATMINSVKKYGGFYIGRYELTEVGEKAGKVENTGWYKLYAKCKTLAKSESDCITRMIWGCQWDITCKWIETAGYDITNSSTAWGNYYNATVTASDGKTVIKKASTATLLETGITTYTMANNIYDLAGNVNEWTQEVCVNNSRTFRGGGYGINDRKPASYRFHGDPAGSLKGSRAVLLMYP